MEMKEMDWSRSCYVAPELPIALRCNEPQIALLKVGEGA